MHLVLHPGPLLLVLIEDHDDGQQEWVDVTASSVEYLFEPLELSQDLTLGDIFSLFEACPALGQVFARFHSASLCEEARLGPLISANESPKYFLELRRIWWFNSHQRIYSDINNLQLSAMAPTPTNKQAGATGPRHKELFTSYDVAGSSVRSLLHVPLRFSGVLEVLEDDTHAKKHMGINQSAHCTEVQLGDVLKGILRSLTFFGSPQDMEDLAAQLHEMDEKPGTWSEPMTAEAYLMMMHKDSFDRACHELFEHIGNETSYAIGNVVRLIPDKHNAQRWLQKKLGQQVRVRAAYANLNGRNFRQAYNDAWGLKDQQKHE